MSDASTLSNVLTYRLAARTAFVAAIFSAIVAALMLYDYSRRAMKDPSQTESRQTLKAAQKQQPENAAINDALEKLDRDSREEYFRQRRFANVGGGLLCGGLIVFLIAARWSAILRRRAPLPQVNKASAEDWEAAWTPAARCTVGGMFVVLMAAGIGLAVPGWSSPRTASANTTTQTTAISATVEPAKTAASPVPISAEILAQAWPCFRGRGGTGISPYANVPDDWDGPSGKNILWKSPVPLPGNSSPVIVAGRIYLTGADENQRQVYCFDATTGKKLWQADVPSTPESRTPVKLNDDAGYAACTMVTDGNYVAAIFPNGDMAAYDLGGKLAWSKSFGIPDNPYGHAASLAIYDHLVIVPIDQGAAKALRSRLRGIDIATGRIAWDQLRPVRSSWTSPIVIRAAGRDQIITVADTWAIAYNPSDGKELWRAKMEHGDAAPSPVAAGGRVFATIDDNAPLVAIRADGSGDVSATRVVWKTDDNVPNICSPLATDEYLFLLKSEGNVACYDAVKGDKLWEEDLGDFKCKSSPSMIGKELLIFGENGKCWVLEPSRSGVKRIRQTDLGEGCVTSAAFQDGRMFVRGKTDLFCIGRK